jgi:Uma2 family endonuclease
LTINNLENGEYKTKQFRENQEIESLVFSELKLTAAIIFEAE